MRNRSFLFVPLLAVLGLILVAFSGAKNESAAVYEYVTIKQGDVFLEIFEQGKEYSQVVVKKTNAIWLEPTKQ